MSTPENYVLQGLKHIKNDTKIGWADVKKIMREIEGHTRALANVSQMGQEWGEKEEIRIRNVMMEQATVVPQIQLTQKDHKTFTGDIPQPDQSARQAEQ